MIHLDVFADVLLEEISNGNERLNKFKNDIDLEHKKLDFSLVKKMKVCLR